MVKNTEGEGEEAPLEKDKGRKKRREVKNKHKNKSEPLDPDEEKDIPEETEKKKGITPDKVRAILDNLGRELPPEKLEIMTKGGKEITVRFHPDLAENNFPGLISKLETEKGVKIIPKWDDGVDMEKGFVIVSETVPEKPETALEPAEQELPPPPSPPLAGGEPLPPPPNTEKEQKTPDGNTPEKSASEPEEKGNGEPLPPPLASPLEAGGEESLLEEIKSKQEETEPKQKEVKIEEVILEKTAAKTETEKKTEKKEIPPRVQEVLDRLNAELEKHNDVEEVNVVFNYKLANSPLGADIKKLRPQSYKKIQIINYWKEKGGVFPLGFIIEEIKKGKSEEKEATPEKKPEEKPLPPPLASPLEAGGEESLLKEIKSKQEKTKPPQKTEEKNVPPKEEKKETEIPQNVEVLLSLLDSKIAEFQTAHPEVKDIDILFSEELIKKLGVEYGDEKQQAIWQKIDSIKEKGFNVLNRIFEDKKIPEEEAVRIEKVVLKKAGAETKTKRKITPTEKGEIKEEPSREKTTPTPFNSPSLLRPPEADFGGQAGRGSATEKPREPIFAARKTEDKTKGPRADEEKQKPGKVAREAETLMEIQPSPSRVSEERLTEKRKEYLEAKRLRGKFIGRGEFKGKEGEAKLAQIGEEYSKMRAEYIRGKASEVLKEQKLPATELKTKVVEKLLEEYNKEDGEREKLIVGREKGLGQRFKEWWRRHPKARMLVGYGLTGASVGSMLSGQLWLTPWLIGARAAFAGTGAALGTEGMLSRYSKTLGEKGLVNELVKFNKEEKAKLKKIKDKGEQEKARQKMINDNIAKISPENLAREMGRVKALQEKKGVKLEKIGPYGAVLSALRAREQELLKKRITEAMEKGEKTKEDLLFEAINSGLEREAREMDENVEKAGEAERKKAIKRWVFSSSAGAITAGLTAWWGFHRLGEISGKGKIAGSAAHAKTALGPPAPEGLAKNFEVVAAKGDSVWKMAKRALAEKYGSRFTNLDEARRTYVIDAVKDKIAKNPARFGLIDIDRVKIGQKIDFGGLINNKSLMEETFGKAGRLTGEQAKNILINNETVQEFHHLHPEIRLDSENIDSILAGRGREILGTEPAAAQTDISAPEIAPEETPSLEESAIPTETEAAKTETPQIEETQSPKTETPSPEVAPEQDISEAMIQEIPDWTPEKIAKTTLPLIQKNPKLNTVKGILEHYLANLKNGEIFLPEQEQANTAIKEITKRTEGLGESVAERYEKILLENTKVFIGIATMGRE
ncbi:MAG: hypothetical protein PHW01_02270 [Patescibacteria group bacterium]|nr:hypothetical protein [Patescibacteria group bacterium]